MNSAETLQIKKIQAAYQGYGERGSDVRQGGGYALLTDGVIVGFVKDEGGGAAFSAASWTLSDSTGGVVARHLRTRTVAIELAKRHLDRFGTVAIPAWAVVRGSRK